MERWLELVNLLNGSVINERQAATAIMLLIEKGKYSKEDRPKADALHEQLNELVMKWRKEDR